MQIKHLLVIPTFAAVLVAGGIACGNSSYTPEKAPATAPAASASAPASQTGDASSAKPAASPTTGCANQVESAAKQGKDSKDGKALAKAIMQSVAACVPADAKTSHADTSTPTSGTATNSSNQCTTVQVNGKSTTTCTSR